MIKRIIQNIVIGSIVSLCLSVNAVENQVAEDNVAEKYSLGINSFNNNWQFKLGESKQAYKNIELDDTWRLLNLPHDWAIEQPFSRKYNARTGGLPIYGTGWYSKSFELPKKLKSKTIYLRFDGAMYNTSVYVNGQLVGSRPFGYIGFEFDISQYLNYGDKKNLIAVRLNPENFSTRWYPGAGIYRDVWLDINEPMHIAQDGIFVTTSKISEASASVNVITEVTNNGNRNQGLLVSEIRREDGHIVARQEIDLGKIRHNSAKTVEQSLLVETPIRWDVSHPYQYTLVSTVKKSGEVVEQVDTKFGIRTLEFTADKGFFLNGSRVEIRGVCLHHDNGPLGAVANRRAIQRKLEIMLSMGVNSIRTSHNPPSPHLVELADEMGILLQVEAFDVWKTQKRGVHNGYNKYFDQWHERDLRDMIRRHRNSPSVFMWSIGNEITEQKHKDGWKIAKQLADIARDEDPSRLVAAGFNNHKGAINNGLAAQVDIQGFNYKPLGYGEFKKTHPEWIILASETSSVVSTRGTYHLPIEKYEIHDSRLLTSYDIIAPPWAYPPDIEFDALKKNPFVIGQYVWTGFDYLGEPTPYGGKDHITKGAWNTDWPVRSSSFGIVDLVGFKKDRFYLYQAEWTTEPMVHVLPHWNWPNRVGQVIPVFAYTNAEKVELFVNGQSQGIKVKGVDKTPLPIKFSLWDKKGVKDYQSPYRLHWNVKYQPGEIEVRAYNGDKIVARKKIATAGNPAKVELIADRSKMTADGQDLSYISVLIKDKLGNIVPDADNLVRFFVEGAGEIAAVGNGNPSTTAAFITDYRRVFNGKAMLIVRSKPGEPGDIKVRAYSEHLKGDEISIVSD